MLRKIKKILSYHDVFISTKLSYWWKFYKYSYRPQNHNLNIYLNVPPEIKFYYLPIEGEVLSTYLTENSNISNRILKSANEILKEHYPLFNIQTKKILEEWHRDPVTGYEFPHVFYKDVRKITPQGSVIKNNDIKYPWELSCSHFLVTLAEAYILTKDSRYEDMFFKYLEDWHKNNPVGIGVNWSCTLDVALRVVNFIVAASIFHKADESFNERFNPYVQSIYTHMLFIEDNLEYGFVRENHYLSDIVGLKISSQCFPDDKKAKRCYKKTSKSIREEIIYQVCKDGVDHEASTCYHGFCLDLFMIALATDYNLRNSLNEKEKKRLCRMIRFSEELCQFATYPIVGDNDGERVVDLNASGSFRKEVVQFGKQVMGLSKEENEYSFLINGTIKSYDDHYSSKQIIDYKKGGYSLVINDYMRLLIHCGTIGRKGKGGHGHNDQTSFIMDVKGEPFILDPGSMVYERDLQLRHDFRSTAIHNCIMVGNNEQNVISINRPFKMDNNTKASFTSSRDGDSIFVTTTHKGYKQYQCLCIRRLEINQNCVQVIDNLHGSYNGDISCLYTFAKGLYLEWNGNRISVLRDNVIIASIILEGWNAELIKGRFSPAYGVMDDVNALRLNSKKDAINKQFAIKVYIE